MENNNQHIDMDLLTRFLSGEASEAEIQSVLLWKEASEENNKQFNEFEQVWNLVDQTSIPNNIDIDAEWNYLNKKIHKAHSGNRYIKFRTILRIAAAIIIGTGIFYLSLQTLNQKSFKSPVAASKEIILPDGSHVRKFQ
jgi:ferric-dicitrate binding protein FerR (iron transport regulator)